MHVIHTDADESWWPHYTQYKKWKLARYLFITEIFTACQHHRFRNQLAYIVTMKNQFNKNVRKTQDIRGPGLDCCCTATSTDDRRVYESTIKHHVHLTVYI